MALPITRRSLLAAMPVTATAIALPTMAGATCPDTGLEQAIAAYEAVKAEADHFHMKIYDPAYDTYQSRAAAIPHKTTTRQFASFSGEGFTRPCTSDAEVVTMARKMVVDFPNQRNTDFLDTCRELVALADDRDRRRAEIAKELNIEALNRRSDELGAIAHDALLDVELYPVTTLPAMLRKIGVLYEAFGEDDDIWGEWTLADLRRIAGEA